MDGWMEGGAETDGRVFRCKSGGGRQDECTVVSDLPLLEYNRRRCCVTACFLLWLLQFVLRTCTLKIHTHSYLGNGGFMIDGKTTRYRGGLACGVEQAKW